MSLKPGDTLGAYRIIRPLGEGGMGHVYEAEHMALKVCRALKVFATESEYRALLRKRFAAEGRILADLRHPRIVRVYDFAFDEATGTPFFAMDLVLSPAGTPQTLETVCRNGVDEDQVAGWFRDICEGLDYIHAKGIVHRDIALDNILIAPDGHAVISDFGIARIIGEDYRRKIEITMTLPMTSGEVFRWGKGLYQAPELKNGGEATPASDAYAVGVLLFRLLAGSWYTPDTRLEDALAGLEYNWADVIGRLCALAPDERLETAGSLEVHRNLLRKSPPPPRMQTRHIWPFLAALLGMTALILTAVLLFTQATHTTPSETMPPSRKADASAAPESILSQIIHVQEVTNNVVKTNFVRETVYQIVPVSVTNVIEQKKEKQGSIQHAR